MSSQYGTNDLDLRTSDRGDLRTTDRDRDETRRRYTETKLGTRTTEFYVMIVAVAGTLAAAYVDDNDGFTKTDGFRYAALMVAAYILSRGLAKLGTPEPYDRD